MENTTETVEFDGTIDSAVDMLIQPDEPEENLDVSDEAEYADYEDVTQDNVEDSSEDDEDVEASEDDSDYEDEDEDTEVPSFDENQLFPVIVDGKEEMVTFKEMQRGYSGQQYVQKGMQQNAEMRKQNEGLYNSLLAERQHVAQLYQQLTTGQIMAQPPQPPSRELFDSDPIGYMEAKLNYDEQVSYYNMQQQQFVQLNRQQQEAQQAATQAYLQQEMKALTERVPELADPKLAPKVRDALVRTGGEYGFQPEEIANIQDSRAVHVLRDAMKYREILAGKKKADEKANPANRRTRPVKAGAKRTETKGQKFKQQKAKLRQSGSIDDALGLILNA